MVNPFTVEMHEGDRLIYQDGTYRPRDVAERLLQVYLTQAASPTDWFASRAAELAQHLTAALEKAS